MTGMKEPREQAFTLIEILVVIIVLGILATIIVPKVGTAADEARRAALASDLRTVREQMELYRLEHGGSSPTVLTEGANQLTARSLSDGTVDPAGKCGPYLHSLPTNPFNGKATAEVENGTAGLGDGSHGWHLDSSTGEFRADTLEHGKF